MRGHVARKAFALGGAGLMTLAIAGCTQSTPEEGSAQTSLSIVEKVQTRIFISQAMLTYHVDAIVANQPALPTAPGE